MNFRSIFHRSFSKNELLHIFLRNKSTNAGYQRHLRRILTRDDIENERRKGKPLIKEAQYSKSDLYSDSVSAAHLKKQLGQEELDEELLEHKNLNDELQEIDDFDGEGDPADLKKGRYKNYKGRKNNKNVQEAVEQKIFTTGGIEWRKLEKSDQQKFMNLMVNLKDRKKRDRMNKIMLEGRRLISEALTAGIALHSLYFIDEEELKKLPLIKGEGEIYRISNTRMEAWSSLETPPGIFAIFEKPEKDFIAQRQSANKLPVTVVLENLRDPGNMGSVLRALSAAGCHMVIAMPGCCDVWESKVLRGGMGAHFSMPIVEGVKWEYLRNHFPSEFSVFLADNNAFEIVNEAESYKIEPESKDFAKFSNVAQFEENEEGDRILIDKDMKMPNSRFRIIRLPLLEHFRANFAKSSHIVLILGGETAGISNAAYQFVHKFKGVRCHIPMTNNVDSLNVATAASIIIFEIKRQFSLARSNFNEPQTQENEELGKVLDQRKEKTDSNLDSDSNLNTEKLHELNSCKV